MKSYIYLGWRNHSFGTRLDYEERQFNDDLQALACFIDNMRVFSIYEPSDLPGKIPVRRIFNDEVVRNEKHPL